MDKAAKQTPRSEQEYSLKDSLEEFSSFSPDDLYLTLAIATIISQSFDLSQILERSAREIVRYLSVDRCLIIQCDTSMEESPIVHIGQYCASSAFENIRCSKTLNSILTNNLENLIISDNELYLSSIQSKKEYYKKYNIQSEYSVPIVYRGILCGLISVHRCSRKQEWLSSETNLLKILSTLLGGAIYQAFLFEDEQRAKEAMRQTNYSTRQFIANVTHELRSPLHNIIAGSSMVGDEVFGPLNDKQKEYMEFIGESGNHLLRLVNDLLDTAKMESNTFSIQKNIVQVASLVDEVQKLIAPLLEKKNQRLSVIIDDKASFVCSCDKQRMVQVLGNILNNASKFTHEFKPIKLHVSKAQENSIRFSITDQGPGIPKQQLDNIFEPFVQGEHTAMTNHKGTGLGLPIAKKIVELHHGSVHVESNGGQGSTFHVDIPL